MKIKGLSCACYISMLLALSNAQQLPPIFDDAAVDITAAETVTQFPVGTFLESIAIDEQGNLFVTSLEEGKLYKVTPEGKQSDFAQIEGQVAGLAFDSDGDLLVTGWAGGDTPSIFRVSKEGQVETLAVLDGAAFLNGITHLKDDEFLIADSYRGLIWKFDEQRNTYNIWLEDEALTRSNPDDPFPAVNGLKVFEGALYATNTQRQTLLRIPIIEDGEASELEVIAKNINGDDFALDSDGNLYITTHVYNSVVRVDVSGNVTIIASVDEGMTGSTALAFGRSPEDSGALFVVTNGGMSLPPPDGVQPAKVVRLQLED